MGGVRTKYYYSVNSVHCSILSVVAQAQSEKRPASGFSEWAFKRGRGAISNTHTLLHTRFTRCKQPHCYTHASPPTTVAIMKLETVQFDARFPNQNQTKACWQYFVDYHKVGNRISLAIGTRVAYCFALFSSFLQCIKAKGEDYAPCVQFFKAYKSICPDEWVCLEC